MIDASRTAAPVAISLAGEYDVYNSDEFARLLDPVSGERDVILDFNAVRRLDCTAFTNLLRMRRRRSRAHLPVERLVGLSPQLRRLFRITHLDEVWPLFDTLDEALESFSLQR